MESFFHVRRLIVFCMNEKRTLNYFALQMKGIYYSKKSSRIVILILHCCGVRQMLIPTQLFAAKT